MPTATATSLVWDLRREKPTLGGALVLRMEGEMLARDFPGEPLHLSLLGGDPSEPFIARLLTHVFGASVRRFACGARATDATDGWPDVARRVSPDFTYFGFARVQVLHAETGAAPRLAWSPALRAEAARVKASFPRPLICIHLRRTPPYIAEESNADPAVWGDFLRTKAAAGCATFLLLGDDPALPGLASERGIIRARDLGLSLSAQMALIAQADGFLGMASGLCTTANFSETPHVIFKHPAHHPAAMRAELGNADRFAFATPQQRLWRRVVDRATLEEAFALIRS